MHNYNPPTIRKIVSAELRKNLSVKDYGFIKNYNVKSIKPLLDVASYLDMQSLRDVCITFLATKFYI